MKRPARHASQTPPARRVVRAQLPVPLRPLTSPERRLVNDWLDRLPYHRPRFRLLVGDGLVHMHAASFLPHRYIVLDRELLAKRRELGRVLYHEVFHFVWTRLGNPLRLSYERLLRREWQEGARGELGWPAEERKLALRRQEVRRRAPRWRQYVCESFCDSAAWFCLGERLGHREWTLKPRFRRRRRQWLLAADLLPRLAWPPGRASGRSRLL